MRIAASLQGCGDRVRTRTRRARTDEVDQEKVDFIVVTDLWPEGASLVTPSPLELGREVAISIPMLEPLRATIIWVSRRLAGCRFADPLHPALLRVVVASVNE